MTKMMSQIEQLKSLNTQAVERCEEMKAQIAKLKKQHAQELHEKLTKAGKHSEDVEAEIQVLKEMIKSVKLQLKSKDTDI